MDKLSNIDYERTALLDSVSGYEFGKLKPNFEVDSRKFIQPEDFKSIGNNLERIQEIDTIFVSGSQVAILEAAKRMGTLSVGKIWVFQNPNRQYVDLRKYDKGAMDSEFKIIKPELFLDELRGSEDEILKIEKILVDDRKLVIRPHLPMVKQYKEAFSKAKISFGEVKFSPLSDDQMADYLSRRFALGQNDAFVRFVTKLSGGSLFAANNICDEFLDHDYVDGPILNMKQISVILEEVRHQIFLNFDQDGNKTKNLPEELKQLVPHPKLFELFS